MNKKLNGRRRALFDEELVREMENFPAERVAPPKNADRSRNAQSAHGQKGSEISLLSAILTGHRSRAIACILVAVVIATTAVVSVAASIVASHMSLADEPTQVLDATDDKRPSDDKVNSDDKSQTAETDKVASGGEESSAPTEKPTTGEAEVTDTVDDSETDADTPADTEEEKTSGVKGHKVTITFWNKESVVVDTIAATLGDVITSSAIELDDAQLANLDLGIGISSDMTFSADVVTYDTEDVEETVPYETEYRESASLAAGATEVTQRGIEGKQTRRYTVTYVNGVEVARDQSASWVDAYVQNEIITTGTGQGASPAETPAQSTTPSGGAGTIVGANGVTYSYSSVMDVKATCYYAGGTTAYGLPADENVIGVDPTVIPFGTRVYVVGPYGDFGVRIAADCGNMYGERIDICLYRDNPLAAGFGWRDMKVYILD